ncbi:hypothetical protein J6590_083328 [Homalodisca vitripennis]|nr:hypothetical protein J6590_083328 [Homalodisca vitripennis]
MADQKLVISKDRQTYSVYSPDIFARECTRKFGKLTVSSLSDALLSIYQRPNCVVDLLMKEHVKLCSRKLISGLQSSVLIRTPTRWLYATSIETRVILNCLGRDANLNVSAITLKGQDEIPKQDRCDLIADGYRVPARFIGSSSYSSDFGKIVFPEFDGMSTGHPKCKEYSLEGSVQLLRSHYHRRMVIKYANGGCDLLRAALGDSTQHPQAAQTESPLQTLEETVHTVLRPDADQGEIDRDQSGSMSTPRTTTDVKLTVR